MADETKFRAQLTAMTEGTEAIFKYLRLSPEQLDQVCAALHPKVEKLHMHSCNVGDAGVRKLAQVLPRCTSLTWACIAKNKLTDEGAQVMAECLPHCPALEWVCLSSNQITEKGGMALAQCIADCAHLQKLVLYDQGMKPKAKAAVKEAVNAALNAPRHVPVRDAESPQRAKRARRA